MPALVKLAAGGDAAAQILVGEIALEPEASHSEWRRALSAAEREAIFGPPGSTWTATAAGAGDAAAKALMEARGADATIDTARALFDAGERERAKTLAWRIIENGDTGPVLTLKPEDPLYRGLDYFWWMVGWTKVGFESAEPYKWVASSYVDGMAAGLMMSNWLLQFIAPDKLLHDELAQIAVALAGNPGRLTAAGPEAFARGAAVADNLSRRDPDFAPVGAICAKACETGARGACSLDALRILGGYDKLMVVDPPHEAVIPQRVFGRSARAEQMVRRMLIAAAPSAKGEPVSQCLAAALAR